MGICFFATKTNVKMMNFREEGRSMKKSAFKAALTVILTAAVLLTANVSACTSIYVGGTLTEEGAPILGRSEDNVNSQNKLFYISPAARYQKGAVYHGCPAYGSFSWTMTHDSYRFTAFTGDSLDRLCPEGCGASGHPSYTSAGTNEKGVTVSATESIAGNPSVTAADPYRRTPTPDGRVGIAETDLPTILLSEAATAREAVTLLLSLYDTCGCYDGSGLFIGDQREIWYVENCSGTQYLALKLNDDLLFLEPNLSAIGRIDLDDTDQVLASDQLIATAKRAGTFVGNEEENIIDFRASYGSETAIGGNRLVNGLNFLNPAFPYSVETLIGMENSASFCLSNLNQDNEIVPLYTNIRANRLLTADDIINFYKLPGISNRNNLETAFFQIFQNRPLETGTVEWVSMDTGAYNVFLPYFPVVLQTVHEAYLVSTEPADTGIEYPPSDRVFYASNRSPARYTVLPEGWENSYYWAFDALNNRITDVADPVPAHSLAYVKSRLAAHQQTIYDTFRKTAPYGPEAVNAASRRLAGESQKLALELFSLLLAPPAALFTDVPEDAYYAPAVQWAVEGGITAGTDPGLFSPNEPCTRAQTVTFLWRAAGSPAPSGKKDPFSDVPADAYYHDAVLWAAEKGITTGAKPTLFEPNSTVTRGQVVTFLYRAAGAETAGPNGFTDVSESDYFHAPVTWAVERGITNGTGKSTFGPNEPCTRGQIVTFLYREHGG